MAKKKYCVVGASGRSTTMYVQPLVEEHSDFGTLAAIMDINIGRAKTVAEEFGGGCPAYDDFDKMIEEIKPDALLICCTDYVHAKYIVKGLELGLEVFSEKPMCINEEQVEEILEAEEKYNNHIGVCFNMRYYPTVMMAKKLLDEGVIGEIYTANLDWNLARPQINSGHGASYYHRWNAEMEKSGGLLITKATHHFDMANWLIGQTPVRVAAFGKLNVYGPKHAPFQGIRCKTCAHADECEFKRTYSDEAEMLFGRNEQIDGYFADQCVYRDAINIYDTMAITVDYDGGAVLAYTESSASAYEGWKMMLNGSKGRMEINFYDKNNGLRPDEQFDFIRILDMNNNVTTYPMPAPKVGSHGGSDPALRKVLFEGAEPEIPSQKATSREGAYSILIGAAANRSIKEGRMIALKDLLKRPELLK